MPNPIQLLLPALIPSWNFFEAVEASPRVEYALLAEREAAVEAWLEFQPRPGRVSPAAMAGRLLWNARWNEGLFLVTCAERLLEAPTAHNETEIFRRLAAALADDGAVTEAWLTFRLMLVDEESREVGYIAEPRRLADIDVR